MKSGAVALIRSAAVVLAAGVTVALALSWLTFSREGVPMLPGASASAVAPSAVSSASFTPAVPPSSAPGTPAASPSEPSISGLGLASIESLARQYQLVCRETNPSLAEAPAALSGIACEGSTAADGSGDLRLWADYWAPDAVFLVSAVTTGEVDLAVTQAFLADLAAIPYQGADPAAARQFVAGNIDNSACVDPGCITVGGQSHLVLQYGADGARILEISPAGTTSP